MGRGDAEATTIYADAYNRNRELYRFVKTMETYRSTIDKETWLVLSTTTDAFRYLQSQNAAGGGKSVAPTR
jgi:membrane protease subunit HflC